MNADIQLSAGVQSFLLERIESYEQLEMLLLLRRLSGLPSAIASLAEQAGLPEPVALEVVQTLCHRGLAARDGGRPPTFYYAPEADRVSDVVAELAKTYERDPLVVMRSMTANALERLRLNAADRFDALILRKRGAHG